jgi:nitronate monooxygenase/enoyl-[acyl-carrier protein] reductase II
VRTALTERLGIEAPIIQGSLGPWTSVRLTAAVCEAGALGTLGTAIRSGEQVRADIAALRDRTARPFAVNHTLRPFSREAWDATLAESPPVVSLALGHLPDLAVEAHDAGALFVQQVHTVEQALRAAEAGADVVIAQGSEAGGFGGSVSTLALLPRVVDAVAPVPVAAAGGIADGRSLAAAILLGASGANIGTRFLASDEADVSDEWKQAIVAGRAEDAVKAEFAPDILPPASEGAFEGVAPRVLRTAFVDRWNADRDEARASAAELGREVVEAIRSGRGHEYLPFSGQTVGLIDDVLPVAEIVRGLVEGAESVLAQRD